VHGLVKDSAGYVDVISREGEGTTFKLYFPIADAPAADEPVPDGIPGGEGRVLVVDDEPSQRFLAETSLRRLGYEVDVCANGAEALQHVDESVSGTEDGIFGSRSGYDLVILDVIMENGPDGIETCTKVLERFPEQAVLMMSGCTPDKRIEELLSRGVGWIAKPYRLATLAAAVHERIDTARADRSP